MNISSVVIYLKDQNLLKDVTKELLKMQDIEIITSQNDKIAALISSENIDAEIAEFRRIEAIPGVVSVAMIYSYQEELQSDIEKLQHSTNSSQIAEILDQEGIDAKQIKYGGEVPIR